MVSRFKDALDSGKFVVTSEIAPPKGTNLEKMVHHIDLIKAPLLVVQGANDPRVPLDESVQMRDSLLAAGKEVEYIEFADEGHGFARPENRLQFFAAAEQFLAKHMGTAK